MQKVEHDWGYNEESKAAHLQQKQKQPINQKGNHWQHLDICAAGKQMLEQLTVLKYSTTFSECL